MSRVSPARGKPPRAAEGKARKPARGPKRVKTASISLTPSEATHIRDLFAVRLPPNLRVSLSESLAALEDRQLIETRLWDKVVDACTALGVPLEHGAPDYVIAISAPPELAVFSVDMPHDVENAAATGQDDAAGTQEGDGDDGS